MTRPRRVLVLNQFAVPRSLPGGTRHVELFERLSHWSPTIIAGRRALSGQRKVADEGALVTVPVTSYSGNGSSRVINWLSYTAGALMRGGICLDIDVVYGSSPHLPGAVAALILAGRHRSRFVLEVRDLWPQILVDTGALAADSLLYRALKWLERFLYRQADAIVVLAQGSVEAIAAEGIDRSKIHFIPNGADPEDFEVAADRDELRDRLGLAGTVVVYAGAHGPANGLDLALGAAAELRDTDARFVFVGDGIAKRELMAQAAQLRLDNVEFRDPITKSEIPQLFAAADVGLHCLADIPLFHHGVSPNKLYDYMAAGLPVVTNTPGEVASMVDEAGAGEAVGPNEIAVAVKRLMALEPDERRAMGDRGRAWMASNRSRRALAASLEELLSAP